MQCLPSSHKIQFFIFRILAEPCDLIWSIVIWSVGHWMQYDASSESGVQEALYISTQFLRTLHSHHVSKSRIACWGWETMWSIAELLKLRPT